jgi:type II secretory pathway component PulJ
MNHITPKTRSRIFCLIVAMIAITVGSGFAIVWMQQQISRTAQRSQKTEAQLAETVRKLRYLDERIATMHQPVVLQGKVAGTLRPSMDNQIVWVRESNVPSGRAYAVSEPYKVSMDLAFVDLSKRR